MNLDRDFSGRLYTMGEIQRATGLPAATIRAWERRYGAPRPMRSEGRHRLYSERDLSQVRWLMARQAEGMSIGRAVALWIYQSERGTAGSPSPSANHEETATGRSLAELRAAWISACLRFDRRLAQAIVAEAFSLHPVQDASVELLLAGLAEIGKAWAAGEATVQQEHFASAVAAHHVEILLATTAPWRSERVLLACPPGEVHSFPLLFLSLLLRQRGLETVFLGASVPLESLDATVAETRPHLAIISTEMESGVDALAGMAQEIARLGVPVAFGGRPFNLDHGLRGRVAGHFLAEAITAAPEAVDALLSSRSRPRVFVSEV